MKLKLSIAFLVAAAMVASCLSGVEPTSEHQVAAGQAPNRVVRASFSPIKLFDFANYKRIFHKTYSNLLEELVRGKYFLSRAFRAFVSAIKYKYRKSPFYLAVNGMSDWTPDEIEGSKNKLLADKKGNKPKGKRPPLQSEPADGLPNIVPENLEELERELGRVVAELERPSELDYDELKRVSGESGATNAAERKGAKVRHLPMERLIHTGADAQLTAKAASKLTNWTPANNPQYEPPAKSQSFGLRNEQKKVRYWAIDEPSSASGQLSEAVVGGLSGLVRQQESSRDEEKNEGKRKQLPDELWVDLRESGCFTVPRDQGRCGACWAFAATAIFEYLYCMKTGQLVPFSEQYMIDCGTEYIEDADGCVAGNDQAAGNFVKNFGLELRLNYPYNARLNQCPYDQSTELKRTGYIRFNFYNAVEIDINLWPQYIQSGPLFIGISMSDSFAEYGGGVFGWGCDQETPEHSVVLIGHGREDGHEYWLIRNSHSAGWGEGGYAKLAKSAACTGERIGYTYATSDGRLFTPFIKDNQHYDPLIIKKHGQRLVQAN